MLRYRNVALLLGSVITILRMEDSRANLESALESMHQVTFIPLISCLRHFALSDSQTWFRCGTNRPCLEVALASRLAGAETPVRGT